MKAALVNGKGETPIYGDFMDPQEDEQHFVVNVKAAAISQLAKARAAGIHYSSVTEYPFIPGIDGAGYLTNGEPVYFFSLSSPFGSMAELSLVTPKSIVPLPATLDLSMAAAIGNPGMSSWAALTRKAQLRAGETVLINGATGTSGGLAVRIARHLGAGKIIATGRNTEELAKLRTQGADITLTLDELPHELPALMKQGVDVVLDYLWGDSALGIMKSASDGGARLVRFVQIGSLSGQEISLHSKLLRSSGLTMMGSGLGSVSNTELVASVGELLQAAALNDFSVPFSIRPLSEVNDAWNKDDSRCRTVFNI